MTEHNYNKKVTILYIEDDLANRQLISLILANRDDIELIEAETGAEGLESAMENHPDIILLDLSLPDASGYDVLKRLQDNSRTGSTPVIAVSGDSLPVDISRGLDAGFQSYITKPISIKEVFEVLDKTINSLS